MAALATLYRTSIGKKAVMAVSGMIGYGYVLLHMHGNTHIFDGPQKFNEYAEFLRVVGEPVLPYGGLLWIIRVVLLVALIAHVWSAVALTLEARQARPAQYAQKRAVRGTFANMTLRWGGLALFFFILYHLAHFTFGLGIPNFQGHETAYANVVYGFQNPVNVGIYILAVACLGMHLYHGVWSAFHTLGLNNRRWDVVWRWLARLSGVGLFAGFALVPLAIFFGFVR
jgi:succinate dehydrogenase / fumarate reductase, cytochrome b subunit